VSLFFLHEHHVELICAIKARTRHWWLYRPHKHSVLSEILMATQRRGRLENDSVYTINYLHPHITVCAQEYLWTSSHTLTTQSHAELCNISICQAKKALFELPCARHYIWCLCHFIMHLHKRICFDPVSIELTAKQGTDHEDQYSVY